MSSLSEINEWNEPLSKADLKARTDYLINHGMNREEAVEFCQNQQKTGGNVRLLRENLAYTQLSSMVITYGRKTETVKFGY